MEEVRKATQSNNAELEEKIIQKMENALALREEQLEKIKEKIREHVSLRFAASRVSWTLMITFQ